MLVLKLEGGNLEFKEIEEGLESLQKEVKGIISIPFLSTKLEEQEIDIVINDEGKLLGMPYEAVILDENEKITDIICGPVLFASHDKEGNTIGLSSNQVEFIKDYLTEWCVLKSKNTEEVFHLLRIK